LQYNGQDPYKTDRYSYRWALKNRFTKGEFKFQDQLYICNKLLKNLGAPPFFISDPMLLPYCYPVREMKFWRSYPHILAIELKWETV